MATVPPSGRQASALLALALFLLPGLAGCEPTCKATCKKLISCADDLDLPRVQEDDCESECNIQESLYDDQWTDTQLEEDFADIKRCIRDEACGAISEGVCYDEDLFVW